MPEPKVELIVKYFDESLGLEQNIRDMLNERIKEIETQARSMIMQNGQLFLEQSIKLQRYEKLPIDRRFLASMPLSEIFQALTVLVRDPQEMWDQIEFSFHKNYLERVIFKHYHYLFDENTDVKFKEAVTAI